MLAGRVRAALAGLDPDAPLSTRKALHLVTSLMREQLLHAGHPAYFGLFVPAASTIGVIAETLVAAFNPQLASWSHAPFGVEAEQWVLRAVTKRLGLRAGGEGTITTGGSEANLTALLAALHRACPQVTMDGLGGAQIQPCLYVSAQAHHSWRKAARVSGIGDRAVRIVDCDHQFRMRPDALRRMVREDRQQGLTPFMVVGTAGTTSSGAVDPLLALREAADAEELWLHADAAWGGAAGLSLRHRDCVAGLTGCDSMTLDAHKWLSVPMGAGMYLSPHAGALRAVFATSPSYIPATSDGDALTEPYQNSILWSRRFNGLKILLLLMTAGWTGVEAAINHNFALGRRLKSALRDAGWRLVNDTSLPIACFRDERMAVRPNWHEVIAATVNRRGNAWISTTELTGVGVALRACVCNHRTTSVDIDTLIAELDQARRQVLTGVA